ncbi:hypothetical protein OQA88_7647 [Cercophora sp. LCS_1]
MSTPTSQSLPSASITAANTLTTLLATSPPSNTTTSSSTLTTDLAFLATRLQQFSQHYHQLVEWIDTAPIQSPTLKDQLDKTVPGIEQAVERIVSEVGALKAIGGVDGGVVKAWIGDLAGLSRGVIFGTQILSVDGAEEQETRLDHDEARELFAEARNSTGRVLGGAGLVLN